MSIPWWQRLFLCVCLQSCKSVCVCSVCGSKAEAGGERRGQWSWSQLCSSGWSCPEKECLTMDIRDWSGFLICPLNWSGIPSSSHTDSWYSIWAEEWVKQTLQPPHRKKTISAAGYLLLWPTTCLQLFPTVLWQTSTQTVFVGTRFFDIFPIKIVRGLWNVQRNLNNISGKTQWSYVNFYCNSIHLFYNTIKEQNFMHGLMP